MIELESTGISYHVDMCKKFLGKYIHLLVNVTPYSYHMTYLYIRLINYSLFFGLRRKLPIFLRLLDYKSKGLSNP